MKSIFEAIEAAGVPYDHHESDLYVPNTKIVREILEQYPTHKANSSAFWHFGKMGESWIDIPFAYEPYWEKKQEIKQIKAAIAKAEGGKP